MKLEVTKKDVLKYMFLPGIKPRLRNISGDGFASLAFIIALIYNSVGLIPAGHPYLRPGMSGKFGVRHVVAEAGKHLTFSWKHIDQILIYFAIFFGIVLVAFQFLIVLAGFFAKTAQAAGLPDSLAEYVYTANPDEDIAFRILDMVFGVTGFFGSQELSYLNIMADFQGGLHGMFIIYSLGIIVIGALIMCYFIGAVLIETAETGTPFGKRFNHVWVPVRIIVAFGLLIPISFGMNAGQFITLYAAKWGSGFATNGWIYFNDIVSQGGGTYIGPRETLVALPNLREYSHFFSFMSLANTCRVYYTNHRQMPVEAYIVKGDGDAAVRLLLTGTSFEQALLFTNNQDITVRIGHFDPTYTDEKGMVKPLCGEMTISGTRSPEVGIRLLKEVYYYYSYLVASLTYPPTVNGSCNFLIEEYGAMVLLGVYYVETNISEGIYRDNQNLLDEYIGRFVATYFPDGNTNTYNAFNTCIEAVRDFLIASPTWNIDDDGLNLGWAGAGIWYNKIAQVNGDFVEAVNEMPRIDRYPEVMEYVFRERMQQDDNINPSDRFAPQLEQGGSIEFPDARDAEIARVFNIIFQFWEEQGYAPEELRTHASNQGNSLIDTINAIFGTQGLFDMCRNADIHPLAQLATVGKGLIEAAIRNLGYSLASGVMGGAAYILSPHMGSALGAASSFFSTVAGIGLVIGFILYYVLPFMPFLYFFFAVGGWIKGIFEAMVGVPLWALAHLRIDGEGLPGPGGSYGYFLIFEIFLRPFMIVLGLLASITIYAAMVKVLNEIFWLVVSNISGHDPLDMTACTITGTTGFAELGQEQYLRGAVDEFFFTVMYAILVYMIGMSCFKLIDQIPNEIMRWMGANVKTFNDERGETADGLMQRITVSGGTMMGKLQGAAQQGSSFFSSAGQGLLKQLKSGDAGGQ